MVYCRLVEMGCYGVGVSRLLAAALEVGCERGDGERLIWPVPIAPFHVCVLPFVHVSITFSSSLCCMEIALYFTPQRPVEEASSVLAFKAVCFITKCLGEKSCGYNYSLYNNFVILV